MHGNHLAPNLASVLHFKRRRILRPLTAPVVKAGGAYVRVSQPHLYLGNIGVVLQGVGRRRCAQAVHAQVLDDDAGLLGVGLDHGVDAVGRNAGTGGGAAQRAKQRTGRRCALTVLLQVRVDALGGHGMQRQKADLAAFAVDAQVLDAASFLQVVGVQLRRFFAAQAVVQQHGQDGPIAQPLERFGVRSIEQLLGLVIAEGRGLAFVGLNPGPFDAVHRVAAGDRIVFQQVIEEAGQRGQFSADRSPGQAAVFQIGAPGQDVRAGHHAKLIGRSQTDKTAEVFQVILVGSSCPRIVQVGEPLDCSGYPGQILKFDRRQPALIVLGGFRQFLHIYLSGGTATITDGHSSHQNNALSDRRTQIG